MQPLRQDSVARLAERQGENGAADQTPVDERHLECPVAPPLTRPGDPTVNPHPPVLHGHHGKEFFQKRIPVQVAESHRQILRCREAEHLPFIPDAGEGDPGMGNGEDLDLPQKIRGLGLITSQEFAARGDIEEKISHLDRRAGSLAGILHLVDLSSGHLDQRPRLILPAPR